MGGGVGSRGRGGQMMGAREERLGIGGGGERVSTARCHI